MIARRWIASSLVLLAALPLRAAEPIRYFFENFEPATGWHEGPLSQRKSAFTAAQGTASIRRVPGEKTGQELELTPSDPFAAVMLDAAPLAARAVVYSEVFARPAALGEEATEEFLDFGGAVLGFFRDGDQGEICALAGKTEKESVWIASGVRFPLTKDGTAAQWMRLTIRLNCKVGRWDLFINGARVLAGMRVTSRARTLRLWLYGDAQRAVSFDDVLVANVPPEFLEKEFPENRLQRRESPTVPAIGRQVVRQRKANGELRESSEPLRAARGDGRLNDWHVSLQSGDRTYHEPEQPKDLKLIAYAPSYDDAGNPLPVTITLTADAELEPGADLADLRWRVRELLGLAADNRPKLGVTVVEGNFRGGLVQTVTIPPEWARKATSVEVWAEK